MPVKKEPSGRRSVQAEVEVPGTPEQVWRAIATGPGISSWFVPTRVEEREGGAIEASFGPGMDSHSKITAWHPPHRYAADSPEDMGPGSPSVATEWIVEAKGAGTCVVRVVHSWFASTDDWDDQFEQHEFGWRVFFRTLRLVLSHFRDQPSASVQLTAMMSPPKEEAWAKLTSALGIDSQAVGAAVRTPEAAPRLSGHIEHVGEGEYREDLLLRIEEPAPGLVHLFAMPMGEQVILPIRLYLFGEQAAALASRTETTWRKWLEGLNR